MSHYKAKLLLIISVILVGLLSNILSIPFIDFEGKGGINYDTALAFTAPDSFQNNTDIQSTTSPIDQTNNSSSEVSALVDKAYTLYSQGNYTQAIQYYDKALVIDPNLKEALNGKGNALSSQGNYTQAIQYYNKALAINSTDSSALYGKQDAISKIARISTYICV
jgi:tetratricopeptide (TPR) repeat protein